MNLQYCDAVLLAVVGGICCKIALYSSSYRFIQATKVKLETQKVVLKKINIMPKNCCI